MFIGELTETRQREIFISNVDEIGMELWINYCYIWRIVVDEKMFLSGVCILQVNQIFHLFFFIINQLEFFCLDGRSSSDMLWISSKTTWSNKLFEYSRAFPHTYSYRELWRIADRYTEEHLIDVKQSEEFLCLPLNQ
jgi:hypothetical protein